jgi:DNA replication and repair protein RecF
MLQSLELTNIRSYESGLFQFEDGVNIIVGPNASGKTNLLEAIFMSARGKAFKSDDTIMVHREADWARIDAVFDEQKRIVKIKLNPTTKVFNIDGVEKKRLTEQIKIAVVLFEPSHMLLLGGEPERRRNHIDDIVSQTHPGYAVLLRDYKRALAQRNKLLKQDAIQPEHMFVWDVRLSELAGKIVEKRADYIKYLQEHMSENYQNVSGSDETIHISYDSKFPITQYNSKMLEKLKDRFSLDAIRGFTSVGPHRDDIKISINGNDVRDNASRGETRSVVLALKIAELKSIERYTDTKPILLLDDVFSELDGRRRRTMANTLQEYQTFITTTDADVVVEHFSQTCNVIPL